MTSMSPAFLLHWLCVAGANRASHFVRRTLACRPLGRMTGILRHLGDGQQR